jgi:hypothetical protein
MIKFKTHFLICEGGVAGHMSHVYENINLTGVELKELFNNLIQGNRTNVTEKVDGQNIFFTWDEISNTVRFARRNTDIQNNGVNLDILKQRFASHPDNVRAAFVEGGEIIQTAILNLTKPFRDKIFGKAGNRWINAEIMHTQNPNIIQYSGNYIVMHNMSEYIDGDLIPRGEEFKLLTRYLDRQTARQSERVWSVVGPRIINIENFNTLEGPYGEFCNKIDEIFKSVNLNSNSTISSYIKTFLLRELSALQVPEPLAEILSSIIIGTHKSNIVSLKKQYGTAYSSLISDYGSQANTGKVKDRITRPFQEAITNLSVEVLKTISSYFVNNPNKEIERVRNELRSAIIAIENTKDEYSQQRLEILKKQLFKLKSVENFCSTVEGIVFEEPPGSGNLYKITGSFAPANQILGLVSYGRGTIPPLKLKNEI